MVPSGFRPVPVAAALLLLVATGCSDTTPVSPFETDTGPDFRPFVATLDSLGDPSDVFAPGDPVTLRLSVVNATDSVRTMTFSSSQRYDFVVEDDGGVEVWRWSLTEVFTPATDRISFKPRETKRFEETWPQRAQDGSPVAAGDYRVTGTVTSQSPAPRSASHDFAIR